MSKVIKNNKHNKIKQDMLIYLEADENEGDQNLDLRNGYEISDEDQLKEHSHEYKRVRDRPRSLRNKNKIRFMEGTRKSQKLH